MSVGFPVAITMLDKQNYSSAPHRLSHKPADKELYYIALMLWCVGKE